MWEPFNRLSVGCTLREALTRYLDITGVPTPQMLSYLAKLVCLLTNLTGTLNRLLSLEGLFRLNESKTAK